MHLKLTDKNSGTDLLIPVDNLYVEAGPEGRPVKIGVLGRGGSYRRVGETEMEGPFMMEVKETLPQIWEMLDIAKYCCHAGVADVVSFENRERLLGFAEVELKIRFPR